MNRLVDFDQICMNITLGHDEELISFGDLDPILKVTYELKLPNLSQKSACLPDIMNHLVDFN